MSRRSGPPPSAALIAGWALAAACVTGAPHHPAPESGPPKSPIQDRYAGARIDLLVAINQDRHAAGVVPVRLDSLATVAAQGHASAMAAGGFFSHYGQLGEAPYERLAGAGLTGHVQENVWRWQVRGLVPIGTADPWGAFDVNDAHGSLMASPGHRETILDPHRTHVGLGIASDAAGGAVYVVEDFMARYVEIDPPRLAWPGSETPLTGRVLDPSLRPLLLLLHREPEDTPGAREGPPPGPYTDGRGEGRVVPPWAIAWRPAGRSFELDLGPLLRESGRWYGVVYVAPRRVVEGALAAGAANTAQGWPGAAFVVDVY
ncbi:MAG: CAP domain-containing protein [Gemmatimonadota bacterium]